MTTAPRQAPPQTIAQGHLNTFTQCPRRYQYQYLEQLGAPLEPAFQTRTEWGSQFHLLMQQYVLGLLSTPLPESPMNQAVRSLTHAVPELQAPWQQDAEHRRVLTRLEQQSLLVVVYDLLALHGDRAHILDWKTYPKPPNLKKLANNWQTLLYPFVLVATSDYEPEQVTMTYWFVQAGQTPESWSFEYNQPTHERIQAQLHQHLEQIQTLTEQHQNEAMALPMLDATQQHPVCQFCPFQTRCQQETRSRLTTDWSEQVTLLPEVEPSPLP